MSNSPTIVRPNLSLSLEAKAAAEAVVQKVICGYDLLPLDSHPEGAVLAVGPTRPTDIRIIVPTFKLIFDQTKFKK